MKTIIAGSRSIEPNDPLFDALMDSKYALKTAVLVEQNLGDIDPTFIGFTDIYKALSELIPIHFRVVDLGCGYGFQSWYFRKHRKYTAVDLQEPEGVLMVDGAEYIQANIQDYVKAHKFDDPEFAICSYVPPWHGDNCKAVRETFKNCFCYYPEGGENPFVKNINEHTTASNSVP